MNIQELKTKSSEQLINQAEELGIENASTLRRQEILFAINYLLKNKESLLIKPMQWFFENIYHFSHIFIASLLELFLIYVYEKQVFFKILKDDILKIENLKNLYISSCLKKLIKSIE